MRTPLLATTVALALALAPAATVRAETAKKPQGPPASVSDTVLEGPKTTGGGRITIDKPVVDVGDIVRGTAANAVFEIKNTGTDVLKILSARPG